VKVKVIKIKGQAALVEWEQNGAPKRGTIPARPLEEGYDVEKSVLDMAIPYGEPWAMVVGDVENAAQAVEDELHRRGIWTAADLLAKRAAARDAVAEAVGASAAKLIRYAAERAR